LDLGDVLEGVEISRLEELIREGLGQALDVAIPLGFAGIGGRRLDAQKVDSL
jgi:hypothetical protein